MRQPMLKRLPIRGDKSLRAVGVSFRPLTVLFGPNAAGKSNLVDALQPLSKIATCCRLRDAVAPPSRGTPRQSLYRRPGRPQGTGRTTGLGVLG